MSNVLHILIDQAKEKADACIKAMAKTQQMIAQGEQKLAMLTQYETDCHTGLHNRAAQGGITGLHLRNQNAFVGKISQAIEQQRQELDFLGTTLTHQKQQYQLVLQEQRKYEALVEREKRREALKEAKRDQKMNDEYAARIARVHAAGELS